jgi:hypothetical protein
MPSLFNEKLELVFELKLPDGGGVAIPTEKEPPFLLLYVSSWFQQHLPD